MNFQVKMYNSNKFIYIGIIKDIIYIRKKTRRARQVFKPLLRKLLNYQLEVRKQLKKFLYKLEKLGKVDYLVIS